MSCLKLTTEEKVRRIKQDSDSKPMQTRRRRVAAFTSKIQHDAHHKGGGPGAAQKRCGVEETEP